MIELVAAISVVLAVLVLIAHWQHKVSQVSQQMRRQHQALLAIDNALEILADIPWDELNEQTAQRALAGVASSIGTPKVFVHVKDEEGTPPVKRIEVWVPREGQATGMPLAQLSLWRFRS